MAVILPFVSDRRISVAAPADDRRTVENVLDRIDSSIARLHPLRVASGLSPYALRREVLGARLDVAVLHDTILVAADPLIRGRSQSIEPILGRLEALHECVAACVAHTDEAPRSITDRYKLPIQLAKVCRSIVTELEDLKSTFPVADKIHNPYEISHSGRPAATALVLLVTEHRRRGRLLRATLAPLGALLHKAAHWLVRI